MRSPLDWLHEQGKRRAESVPEFDVEATLRCVRAARAADASIRGSAAGAAVLNEPPSRAADASSESESKRGSGSARIFISYRRADASWPARWLTDRLVDQFGPGVVFQDVDAIQPGVDFAAEIEDAVGACSVLLAVIGPRWLGAERVGERRIDDPQDWVRLEIETALKRGIRVIPVLVDEAGLPSAHELPPGLQSLARKQPVVLNPVSLDIRSLTSVLKNAIPPWRRMAE
jgi:hypothetical protein